MASWRIDDLDGGLASDLLNLSGLGNEFPDGAYNMRYVHIRALQQCRNMETCLLYIHVLIKWTGFRFFVVVFFSFLAVDVHTVCVCLIERFWQIIRMLLKKFVVLFEVSALEYPMQGLETGLWILYVWYIFFIAYQTNVWLAFYGGIWYVTIFSYVNLILAYLFSQMLRLLLSVFYM